MNKIVLISCMVMGIQLFGALIPKETRYKIYEMTATEEQMVDETWKMFWTSKSEFRKLAVELLQIDINGVTDKQYKQAALPKVVFLERDLLKKYNEGLNKIKKVRTDGLKSINYSQMQQYRETFFKTIKDEPTMQEWVASINSMRGTTSDFTEWFIHEKGGDISTTVKRSIKWNALSAQDKVNWIYRYSYMKNLINEKAKERAANRQRAAKRSAEVKKKQNENGKPAIMPLKINRKAIGSK